MASAKAKKFYSSKRWQDCRNAYATSKHFLCERCLEKGVISKGEIVHHKTYITDDNLDDPDVTLNWNNLELVCWSCHEAEHKGKNKRYKVAADGSLFF